MCRHLRLGRRNTRTANEALKEMRDPERIERILSILRAYWQANPDLRLGQIVVNMSKPDPFYLEDEILEERLRENLRSEP